MFFELLLPAVGSNVAIDFPTLVKDLLNSSAIAKGFDITSPLEFISLVRRWRAATLFIIN